MKKRNAILFSLIVISIVILSSCTENKTKKKETVRVEAEYTMKESPKMELDKRMSLKLKPMQKNHQLINMRSHLEAVQNIVTLLSSEKYDEASELAHTKLGLTTEMKLMCTSFGDKNFENLGLEFHKSADKMGEVFKSRDKNKSLEALSKTLTYCVQCHSTYRQ